MTTQENVAGTATRTVGSCLSSCPRACRLWLPILLAVLGSGGIAGCGSSESSKSDNQPAATPPRREPLPAIPEQSEPEDPETSAPVGAEPATKASNVKPAAEPSDDPNSNETPSEPGADKPDTSDRCGGEPGKGDNAAGDDSSRYEFRANHDPNGIGKFYMGREIAHVMGFAAAPWLERPEREQEEATSKLIKALALKEGMVVADIGAGSGVLTLPIAGRVGRDGKVFAVDVQQKMLDRLAGKIRARRITNVEPILGSEKTPRLDEASVDLALMVDVYHEFEFPYEMLLEISRSIKPGGRVIFVEFRMEDPKVPIKLVHKMTEAQVKKEAEFPEFRLKWKETIGTLPWQHVIVFEKQADEADRPKPAGDKP